MIVDSERLARSWIGVTAIAHDSRDAERAAVIRPRAACRTLNPFFISVRAAEIARKREIRNKGAEASTGLHLRLYSVAPPRSQISTPLDFQYLIACHIRASFGRRIWSLRQLAPPQKYIQRFMAGKIPVAMHRPSGSRARRSRRCPVGWRCQM